MPDAGRVVDALQEQGLLQAAQRGARVDPRSAVGAARLGKA